MNTPANPAFAAFIETWKTAFAKVLSQLGAANVTTPDADPEGVKLAAPEDTETIAVRFAGGGCLLGQLQWSAAKSVAIQCAQLLMSEPLDAAAEFTATHLDGYLEFLRQVAGEAAVAWKESRGELTELVHQADAAGAFSTAAAAGFSLESDKAHGLVLRLDLDAAMLASVAPAANQSAETEKESSERMEIVGPHETPSNLELILDVQLDATIRFGEREMLLQDVFGLMPGAVVELDQLVNEPAELLVAGRLVAKGEVVVVDGNFGLRVTEVLSRAQRAAALSLA
jgi:flagellar motor switch protein FliN/FliY